MCQGTVAACNPSGARREGTKGTADRISVEQRCGAREESIWEEKPWE